MVVVSPSLIERYLGVGELKDLFNLLEEDLEVQSYLSMANVMAVKRLLYNDHGPVHSRIVSGSALLLLELLADGIKPTIVRDGVGSLEDSMVTTLLGAYLHDVGNAIHREGHNIHGCIIAEPVINRILKRVYGESSLKALRLKQEVLHCIFSHDENVQCLSLEAGVVKVADGTDMAEGRARIPYKAGKVDMHSLSALSIKRVDIEKGSTKPVRILVNMDNPAGIFQIEQVLNRKIDTSGLTDMVEVAALIKGKEVRVSLKPSFT